MKSLNDLTNPYCIFQASMYPSQPVLVAVTASLFGFFGMAVYPVAFELSVETSYPVAEATAAGFVLILG